MSWLGKIFAGREETPMVAIEAETEAKSLEKGIFALDGYAMANGLEETREKEYFCGICGWSPISTFPHSH